MTKKKKAKSSGGKGRWIQTALDVRPRRKGKGSHHKKSVRVEAKKKGQLHRDMGLPVGKKIPLRDLKEYVSGLRYALKKMRPPKGYPDKHKKARAKVLTKLRRALFALNVRKLGRK